MIYLLLPNFGSMTERAGKFCKLLLNGLCNEQLA